MRGRGRPKGSKRPLIAQYADQTWGLANLRDLQPRYACLDRPQRNSLVKLDVRVAG